MLVLGRKPGERIVIGEGANRIIITVAAIEHGKARISIEADRGIPILREELTTRGSALLDELEGKDAGNR